MLVRSEVRLKVRVERLVLVVWTVVRVFFQKYMDRLEKRCVLMIGRCLFEYLLAFLDVLGCCFWGLVWGLLLFECIRKKLYVYCKTLR